MIGEQVTHPQFGPGRVVSLFRNGEEWLVLFDNGLRFRRPRSEFGANQLAPTGVKASIYRPPAPMPLSQLSARHLIESLRVGIAPAEHALELTINLKEERESIVQALHQTHQEGGAVRVVVGEYGYGKSHMVELTTQEALNRNFLVAPLSLDLIELPPHQPFAIYREALNHLRYPDTDERGLAYLLEKTANAQTVAQLKNSSPAAVDPLLFALQALANIPSMRQRKTWVQWLTDGRRLPSMNKVVPRGTKFPSLYKIGANVRQISYLLTAVSALARLGHYSGLCLLIDEAESYALLTAKQREKAALFFQSLIYAALRDQQQKIPETLFPQHRWQSYPAAFNQGQALFFLFTVTRSDNRLPLRDWLADTDILALAPKAEAQEVGQFLQRILSYHAQAYGYELGERQAQVRRGAAEHLAQGIRHGRFSMRSVVRLAVELFDLLYLYPDYDVAHLLDELRTQLR